MRSKTAVKDVTNMAATLSGFVRSENVEVMTVIYVPTASKIEPAVVKSNEEK